MKFSGVISPRGRLTRVVAIALAVIAAPAWSQAVPPQDARGGAQAQVSFDVPAGPLATALARFGEQAHLQLVYETKAVQGLRSGGVRGRMTVAAALTQLLSGLDVAYRYLDTGAVTIEPRAAGGTRMLGPVRVEGASSSSALAGSNGSSDATATEGTKSYTSSALSIASKAPMSIKDTPQSVSVMTQQRIQDQNLTDLTSALQQMTGVTVVANGRNLTPLFYSRGFQISQFQVDGGAPFVSKYQNLGNEVGFYPIIDMAAYDHVELLRGADGLFNGFGEPSGSVNLVRKRPLDHQQIQVEGLAGSWNKYRASLDVTGPLTDDARLRGRLVLAAQNNDYFYDTANARNNTLFLSLEYSLTASTLLTGGLNYFKQNAVPNRFGLPRYENGDDLHLPRDTCLCFPWNQFDTQNLQEFVSLEQGLWGDWQGKINLTHNEQKNYQKLAGVSGAVNPVVPNRLTVVALGSYTPSDQWSAEATLHGGFQFLGQKLDLLGGVNLSDADNGGFEEHSNPYSSTFQPFPGAPPGAPTVDPFHFDPSSPYYLEPPMGPLSTRWTKFSEKQFGAYIEARLTLWDRLHASTGVRYLHIDDWTVFERHCTSNNSTTNSACAGKQVGDIWHNPGDVSNWSGHDVSWPPKVTVSYDVTPDTSAYASYTDIYLSQATSLDRNLKPLDPIVGSNWELGAKWGPADGKSTATVALYRTVKHNFGKRIGQIDNFGTDYSANGGYLVPNGSVSCCYAIYVGRSYISQGADLELAGEVARGWQMQLGYTYNSNKFSGGSWGTQEGAEFSSYTPRNMLKLWTRYEFTGPEWLARLSVDGGVTSQSRAFTSGTACVAYAPIDPATGRAVCNRSVPYQFAQNPYSVASLGAQYRLDRGWVASLLVTNLLDKTYYQTPGTSQNGNWYGEPRAYALTLRGKF
jgi:outer-membrane receptor for ferric coprogen and ferric-rhodotorulic acid